jgi:cyclin B
LILIYLVGSKNTKGTNKRVSLDGNGGENVNPNVKKLKVVKNEDAVSALKPVCKVVSEDFLDVSAKVTTNNEVTVVNTSTSKSELVAKSSNSASKEKEVSEVIPSLNDKLPTPPVKKAVTAPTSISAAGPPSVLVPATVQPFIKPKLVRTLPAAKKNTDPALCSDYIDDMYHLFFKLEEDFSTPLYMMRQPDITYRMRAILIDWLIEVHNKFKLHPATLWLCVNILDRYLSKVTIIRQKLQLIGIASLLIACKYEEIYPPEVDDCVYMTDKAYSREDVIKTESDILNKLNYQLVVPTGYHFLIRFLDFIKASERTRNLAYYYAERNLQEYDSLRVKPHIFVCACIYLALMQQKFQYGSALTSGPVWLPSFVSYTGVSERDLFETAKVVIKHVSEEQETASKRKLLAAKKKYSTEKFNRVATLELPPIY